MIRWILCACTLLVVLGDPSASCAQNNRRMAINDLSAVDDDFRFQGEYSGIIVAKDGHRRKDGLQVIARGDGQFDAVRYPGGLPGTGWSRIAKTKLSGSRDGEILTLHGDDGESIVIQAGTATLQDSSGSPNGALTRVVRHSPTLGASPPPRARWLFNGTDTKAFKNGRMSDEGLLQVGTEFASLQRDFTLHIEFRLPYMPYARGQGRSNSGVYLQSRYEVQVLDSFGLEGEKNECGALYRQRRPDINVCLPPLAWQTYDIRFRSPRFDGCGNKIENARITVRHNGVPIHDHVEITAKTGAGRKEAPNLLPTKLQDHSNPVQFRNIWILDHTEGYATRQCEPRRMPRRRLFRCRR